MIDKELKEILKNLKELKGLIDDFDNNEKNLSTSLYEELKKASKQKAILSIEAKNGGAKVISEGSTLSILLCLASLEKAVLERINPPKGLYEFVKTISGIEDADDE